MTWTSPSSVTTGTALTALLWNNQLGSSGSLQYLYNTLTPVATARNIVLRRSTNLTVGAATNTDVSFDTIITTYTNQQQNFTVTTPVTQVPLPSSGMYVASFLYAHSVTSNTTIRFLQSNGITSELQSSRLAYLAGEAVLTTTLIFAEAAGSTITISVNCANAGTGTAQAPTAAVPGNMVLRLVKVSI